MKKSVLSLLFLSLPFLANSIIYKVCSNPFKENSELVCACKDVNLDVTMKEDGGTFGISYVKEGGFSSAGQQEAVIQTSGCEPHFDLDDNENLIPINWKGYIFARNINDNWEIINYKAMDLGLDDCYKISLNSKDALLCKQEYDNVNFYLSRILLHTFNSNGEVTSKVIYRGSYGDKDIDDRVKKWQFIDINGDEKRDIKIFTNNGKRIVLYRVGNTFKESSKNSNFIQIPSSFKKIGNNIYTDNNNATLNIISEDYNYDLKSFYNLRIKNLNNKGISIAYKRFKNNWFVISYLDNDNIVYEKFIYRNNKIVGYILEYPKRLKKSYDGIIEYLNANI